MLLGLALLGGACTEESPVTVKPEGDEQAPVEIDRSAFACGADVSWVTWLEAKGYTFFNQEGVQKECMRLLKEDCGVNAIRLRVCVGQSVRRVEQCIRCCSEGSPGASVGSAGDD